MVALTMATVVIATGFGGPEVLSVVEESVPDPGDGELRVAVHAAGVNAVDYKTYSGSMGADPAKLPLRIGSEAAGVVTAVGRGALGAVGDEVIAYRAPGAYASEIVVPDSSVIPKPTEIDWDEAAGLLLSGATAVHALEATAVAAGDTVLVHGAAGGVGLMAVQLAGLRGARVIATASERNHDLLRGLGATPVVYGDELTDRVRALAPNGVDAAIDLVGTDEAVDVSLELLTNAARFASIAAIQRGADGIKLLGGGPGADPGTAIRMAARMQLASLVASARLRVVIAARYPLVDVAEAHRAIAEGHTVGKIVLTA